MTHHEVETFVNQHISDLKAAMGLEDWRIDIKYGRCDNPDSYAEVSVNDGTGFAEITIDPDKHPHEKELSDTLLHELGHVVLAPFEIFAEAALESASGKLRTTHERLRNYSREAGVRNLMRLLRRWVAASRP